MAQVTRGIRAVLSSPFVYETFQRVVGSHRVRLALVEEQVGVRPGLRVLDVGCGPGDLIEYLPDVDYTGTDMSEAYISSARRRFGDRGRFMVGRVGELAPEELGEFDVVIAKSLLHHIDDDEALHLFEAASVILAPGGKLVTVDPAYTPDMSRRARYVVGRDRGQNIRTPQEYKALAGSAFRQVDVSVRYALLRIPYVHAFMACSGPLTGGAAETATKQRPAASDSGVFEPRS